MRRAFRYPSEPPLRKGWGLPVPLFQLAISFVSAQLQ